MPENSIEKPFIFLVDDVPKNIQVLGSLLKEDGYRIAFANNGKHAIAYITKHLPDLILLDIMMPEMDGYEVCARLKANGKTRHIPIIFITALSEALNEAKAFSSGGVDYITKPFSLPTVRARVKSHLKLKQYQDHLENIVQQRTEELEKAKIAAETSSRAKSLFIANMSHELRTPLNGIIASLDLAFPNDISKAAESHIQTAKDSSHSLLRVIDGILDFSKSEEGELNVGNHSFRLDHLLANLPETVVQKGMTKKFELHFDVIDRTLPNALIGDVKKLKDIFDHIVDNAVKFSSHNPIIKLGIVVKEETPDYALLAFCVKDNGIGIAPENFEKIFKPFVQIDPSTKRRYDGAGMGLAVCKRLVNLMDGAIWLKSKVGYGSTFYFTAKFRRQEKEYPFKLTFRIIRKYYLNIPANLLKNQSCFFKLPPIIREFFVHRVGDFQ